MLGSRTWGTCHKPERTPHMILNLLGSLLTGLQPIVSALLTLVGNLV